MKKLVAAAALALSAGTAAAQDAAYDWSGAYVGGIMAYGSGDSHFNDFVVSNPFDIDGAAVGLTLGYNYQFMQNWIVGVEGDISWPGIDGGFGPKYGDPNDLGTPDGGFWGCGFTACETDIPWYATGRARLGYAVDRALFYSTGGFAVGRIKSQVVGYNDWTTSSTKFGWAVGAGVEYAFTNNWTVKAEYLHVDLGWTDRNAAMGFRADANFDTARFGINYKF